MVNTTKDEILAALTKGLTLEQVNKLQAAKVAIVGCGGLGSNIAVQLTRAGIGALHLIDFDRVELSNLNRQHFFIEDIGNYKVEALAKQLKRINPYLELRLTNEPLTEDNLESLLKDADFIVEALDSPEAKAMLVTGCLANWPDKALVAASGIAGLNSANEVLTKKQIGRFYLSGDGINDFEQHPLCSAKVILCASHQALTLIRLILGLEN